MCMHLSLKSKAQLMSNTPHSIAGFMLSNKALIVSGAFVAASGIILTLVMCTNMNRSMSKVLVGGFGSGGGNVTKKKTDAVGTVKQVLAEDVVEMLTQSKKIIIVPGYGMVSVLNDSFIASKFELTNPTLKHITGGCKGPICHC